MTKRLLLIAALAVIVSAAFLFSRGRLAMLTAGRTNRGFVTTQGGRFVVDGEPFRFVGANVAVMYRDEDRARDAGNSAPGVTVGNARRARLGIRRRWAGRYWATRRLRRLATHSSLSLGPRQWNEEAFVHLDNVMAEAAAK